MNKLIRLVEFAEATIFFRFLIDTIRFAIGFGYLFVKYVVPFTIFCFMCLNHISAYDSAQFKSIFTWGRANQTFLNSVKFLFLPDNI